MSDIKKFDDFFKQSFDGFEPNVPPHIWENIAAERKKRRPVAWWAHKRNMLLLAGISIMLAVGAVILFTAQQPQNNIVHENNDNSKPGTGNKVPAAVVKNDDDKAVTADNTNTASTANTPGTPANNANATQQDVNTADDATGVTTSAKNNTAATAVAGNNTSRGTKARNNKRQQSKPSAIQVSTDGGPADGSDDAGLDKTDNTTDLADEAALLTEPASRDMANLSLVKDWEKIKTTFNAIPGPDCPRAERDAAGNKYYFEVYAGPDYVFKKYSDTGTSLINKRKESLSFRSAYSAGIRYTRVFGNGISLRVGANYSQVNEKFSYVKDNVVQIVYVINTNGDTTDSYYVRGTRYNTSYNRYRTIDLPITLGYEMGNGRFHANINTGVVVNLYSWQSGESLDNNFNPVSITTGKDNNPYQYKTNVGLGFIGAASLYYRLNDNLHLMAEPYLRYNFSPMNKEAVTLQEKFTTIGLRLGIRMDIH